MLIALWEIVGLLDANEIDYALMGGLAVRAHGIPRPTNDVDLTITCARERFATLLTHFESECIQVPEIYKSGWLDRVGEMPLVKLKTMLDQDHWVDLDIFLCETDFQRSLMDRRVTAELDASKSLWIVTPEDLVLLKLIANRPRDLIDVADVLFVQGQLDEPYLRHWAKQLDITDRLEIALATSH